MTNLELENMIDEAFNSVGAINRHLLKMRFYSIKLDNPCISVDNIDNIMLVVRELQEEIIDKYIDAMRHNVELEQGNRR